MFRILSDIHLSLSLVRIILITRNNIKQYPFGIYVGFGFIFIGSGSDYFYRIGFGLFAGNIFFFSLLCQILKISKFYLNITENFL